MQQHENSGKELQHLLRRSMRLGDVDSVLLTLSQYNFPAAEEMCSRFKTELQLYQKGEIDTETYCLKQIQNFNEILNWPDFLENEIASAAELDKKLLLQFVNSQELDKALKLCESIGDISILMQARYNLFENMFNQGLIEIETRELVHHSTQYQLWELGQSKVISRNYCQRCREFINKWFLHLFR